VVTGRQWGPGSGEGQPRPSCSTLVRMRGARASGQSTHRDPGGRADVLRRVPGRRRFSGPSTRSPGESPRRPVRRQAPSRPGAQGRAPVWGLAEDLGVRAGGRGVICQHEAGVAGDAGAHPGGHAPPAAHSPADAEPEPTHADDTSCIVGYRSDPGHGGRRRLGV
jgi:hypothetical protein